MEHGADVGGSATQNPLAEDIELEVFATCSVYCIKYILWKRFQTPIQNIRLIIPQVDNDLSNSIEVGQFFNYTPPQLAPNEKKPSL